MRSDTLLAEVAQHLPAEVSRVLLDKPPKVREKALQAIRQCIVLMEEEGAVLDPVSYRAVVYGVGILSITAAEYGEALAQIETIVGKAKR